ncbi:MAG TPA: hypothetical protein VEI97_14270 [bacterium]|nr:hypothetical protein [bacterium]
MDERYTVAGVTLEAVPELTQRDLRPGSLVGTLGAGVLRWLGGTQRLRTLKGTGLTAAERTALLAALQDGIPVEFDDGSGVVQVVLVEFTTEPELGTDRFRFALTLLAVN